MKVLLTRTWLQSRQSAAVLAAQGFQPVIEPMTRIEPLPWAASAVRQAAHVVVTSPNGARELLDSGQSLDGVSVFAVGVASATPLVTAGVRVAGVAGGTAAELLDLLRARTSPDDGPLLHVGGEELAVDLAGILAGEGYQTRRAVAYRVQPVRSSGRRILGLLEAGDLDCVLFLSRRSADLFTALLARNQALSLCQSLGAVAFSPRIAHAVRQVPWRTLRTAEHPDRAALLAALRAVQAEQPIRAERAARVT